MRIGDIEYTKSVVHGIAVATTPETERIEFAIGIRIRPLLVRVQVNIETIGAAATNQIRVYLENGDAAVPANSAAMPVDVRLMPIGTLSWFLTTSGFSAWQTPIETNWWKLLMPTVTLHYEGTNVAESIKTVLHYRFAELTDDEIIEIAAQRAQA